MAHSITQLLGNHGELSKQLRDTSTYLQVALDSMIRGLSIYNERQRLMLCNKAYKQIYDLPDDLARTGTSLAKIIRHYVKTQTGRDDAEIVQKTMEWISREVAQLARDPIQIRDQTLGDGRIIRVTTQAIWSGGWVDIHEDVTQEKADKLHIEASLRTDEATGLLNTTSLNKDLESRIGNLPAEQHLSVHAIEIANFGEIAQERGLATLFTALKALAKCVEQFSNQNCVAGRASDMTIGIVHQISDFSEVSDLQSRLQDALPNSVEIPGEPPCPIALRFRTSYNARPGENILTLVDRAKPWSNTAEPPAQKAVIIPIDQSA